MKETCSRRLLDHFCIELDQVQFFYRELAARFDRAQKRFTATNKGFHLFFEDDVSAHLRCTAGMIIRCWSHVAQRRKDRTRQYKMRNYDGTRERPSIRGGHVDRGKSTKVNGTCLRACT